MQSTAFDDAVDGRIDINEINLSLFAPHNIKSIDADVDAVIAVDTMMNSLIEAFDRFAPQDIKNLEVVTVMMKQRLIINEVGDRFTPLNIKAMILVVAVVDRTEIDANADAGADESTMTLFAIQNIKSDIENMINAVDRIEQSVSEYVVVVLYRRVVAFDGSRGNIKVMMIKLLIIAFNGLECEMNCALE